MRIETENKTFYTNVQAMRGIASLLVMFVHLLAVNPGMVPWVIQTGSNVVGPAGVDIFFVISGFVVTLSAFAASNKDNTKKSSFLFMLKRIARIYPAYWVVLIFAFLVSPYITLAAPGMPEASALKLFTLTYTYNNKVMVAWTLVYEMFFYLVLSLLILAGNKKFFPAVSIWILVEIIAIAVSNTYDKNLAGYVPLNPQIIQFSSGCLVAFIVKKMKPTFGPQVFFAGVVTFIIMCCVNIKLGNWTPWIRTLTLTLPCAMLIYGAAVSQNVKILPFKKVFLFLGNISFSLYLWHQVTFQTLLYAFDKSGLLSRLPNVVTLIIWSIIALCIGYLSFKFIEKPSYRLFSRKIESL